MKRRNPGFYVSWFGPDLVPGVQGRNLVPRSRPAIGWRKVNTFRKPMAATRFQLWTNKVSTCRKTLFNSFENCESHIQKVKKISLQLAKYKLAKTSPAHTIWKFYNEFPHCRHSRISGDESRHHIGAQLRATPPSSETHRTHHRSIIPRGLRSARKASVSQ